MTLFFQDRPEVAARAGHQLRQSGQRPPALSRAEYWSFLCAAGLLAFACAGLQGWKGKIAGRPATGAFETTRSSDEPRVTQHKRARESGRGRHAGAPWQIPLRGWGDIFWRTYQQTGEDRLLAVAAGVVFYGLLALFPAITAVVSLYGLFANTAAISGHLSAAAGILPAGAMDIVHEQIVRSASGLLPASASLYGAPTPE